VLPAAGSPPTSEAALEFPAVRERLAAHASFSTTRELAVALEPSTDLVEARRLQAETVEAQRLSSLRPALHFGAVHDVRPQAERAALSSLLSPSELLDIASTVQASRTWRRALQSLSDELPTLNELGDVWLSDSPGLVEDIRLAIGEGGAVLDSASPALARIRGELRGAHDRIVGRLRDLMATPQFRDAIQDPVVTQRAGRYVIPIRADARGQVPAIVHDQSASGATLFVEPLAVVEMGNRWRTLQVDEEHEVERILRALSRAVGEHGDALSRTVVGLATLDLARAKAALADEQRANPPELVGVPRAAGDPVLRLERARHPLLTGTVVPISLELGGDFDLLVITGPNTGGKTVALKTAGLLTLMAQAGLFIPAEVGSHVAVFRRVQADIGDEQSLEQSLSTFSGHIRRIIQMLETADACSLVLLDELGAGTDPQEGSALARALLTRFQARGAYVIATTHYPELKVYAHVTPRVQNASVEFDVESLSPTYRLLVGTAGQSNALAIARRLGMPEDIVEAARANLTPESVEVETALGEIARERAEAEHARQQALRDAADAERARREARASLRNAQRQRRELWNQARAEADTELAELRREALRVRQQLQAQGSRREAQEAVNAALGMSSLGAPPPAVIGAELPQALEAEPIADADEGVAPELRVGAEVMVPRLGLPGVVLGVRDGEVELQVHGRRVRMPEAELEGARRPTARQRRAALPAEVPAPVAVIAPAGPDVPYQLDLRGLRRDEALERLEQYLEDAASAGLPQARIVHGKGTGAIRQAVREHLRASPWVARFAPELDASGGDGATAIWLA
jgi:DNA mismatch repair protein MutS2